MIIIKATKGGGGNQPKKIFPKKKLMLMFKFQKLQDMQMWKGRRYQAQGNKYELKTKKVINEIMMKKVK